MIALFLYWQGKYEEALSLNMTAISIGEKAFGPDHPDQGMRLSNQAGYLQNQVGAVSIFPEICCGAQLMMQYVATRVVSRPGERQSVFLGHMLGFPVHVIMLSKGGRSLKKQVSAQVIPYNIYRYALCSSPRQHAGLLQEMRGSVYFLQ